MYSTSLSIYTRGNVFTSRRERTQQIKFHCLAKTKATIILIHRHHHHHHHYLRQADYNQKIIHAVRCMIEVQCKNVKN